MPTRAVRAPFGRLFLAALGALCVPSLAVAQQPSDTAARLRISGTHRSRYEHLQHKYAEVKLGTDAALWLRTTLLLELQRDAMGLGLELADSRVYWTKENTPLGTSFVNPIDFLQAYFAGTIRDLFEEGDRLRLTLGRQTMDLGSRRIVARNRFRNTINALTGLRIEWTRPEAAKLQGFFTFPVQRRSNSVRGEDPRFDIERTGTLFWGIHLRSRPWLGSMYGELQLYGLHETDADNYQTNNRQLITPGFRVFRTPRPGLTDIEIEAFVQAGLSRLSSLADDVTDLSHFAFFAHASLGRTFATGWQPRLVLKYDYASGDEDPNDDANGRFDTLFGARRFDYGPTGIYGPFKRSNISSPEIRFEFAPPRDIDGFLGYRAMWLAQARDVWTTTGVQDADGSSGSFLGHQLEGRLRWNPFEKRATLEAGFARLWLGHFARNAPNGLPDAKDPFYVYAQLIVQF